MADVTGWTCVVRSLHIRIGQVSVASLLTIGLVVAGEKSGGRAQNSGGLRY